MIFWLVSLLRSRADGVIGDKSGEEGDNANDEQGSGEGDEANEPGHGSIMERAVAGTQAFTERERQ